MDSRKLVLKETAIVLAGQVVCVGVMLAIFALLNKFDMTVLRGGLMGGLVAVLNFFFMALCVNLAADRAEKNEVKRGESLVRISYPLRMAVIFLVFFACVKSGLFHLLALLLPMVFTRPILTVAEFFRK